MGTRSLTAVYSRGAYRIAQYGQWDGYPKGQGMKALAFCRERLSEPFGRAAFAARCDRLRWGTDEDALGIDASPNWPAVYPHLSRDAGALILEMVARDDRIAFVFDRTSTIARDGWCEWAWCIDLDANALEAWTAYYDDRAVIPSDRWREVETKLRLVGSWSLDALPSDEEFMAHFANDNEGSTGRA